MEGESDLAEAYEPCDEAYDSRESRPRRRTGRAGGGSPGPDGCAADPSSALAVATSFAFMTSCRSITPMVDAKTAAGVDDVPPLAAAGAEDGALAAQPLHTTTALSGGTWPVFGAASPSTTDSLER